MNENTIISDLYLIEAYCSFFLDKHFAWMQKGDKFVGGEPGYISRRLAVRYFSMQSVLMRELNSKWKNVDEFVRFNCYNFKMVCPLWIERPKNINQICFSL